MFNDMANHMVCLVSELLFKLTIKLTIINLA